MRSAYLIKLQAHHFSSSHNFGNTPASIERKMTNANFERNNFRRRANELTPALRECGRYSEHRRRLSDACSK